MQILRRAKWIGGLIEVKQKDLPATHLFQTARGECGLLQILAIVDDPRGHNQLGVKLRYKLVQTP